MSCAVLQDRRVCMHNGLFEDYGEAILYMIFAAAVLGMMALVLGAFTAF